MSDKVVLSDDVQVSELDINGDIGTIASVFEFRGAQWYVVYIEDLDTFVVCSESQMERAQ